MSFTYLGEMSLVRQVVCVGLLIGYLIILVVAYRGFIEILLKLKIPPNLPTKDEELEGVTIIRPIKGIDPESASCLESSYLQNYPNDKIQILFCVDSPTDTSIPIIKDLILKYPKIESKILISEGYDETTGKSKEYFGPNPKVNNLAKGFTLARFDILWVMDSNVWASSNILRNSVKSLTDDYENGRKLNSKRKVKLVHHVPIALSIGSESEYKLSPVNSQSGAVRPKKRFLKSLGARLDEMFLLTSHAKFYVSLNSLSVAPCVNGKSNIYRRSDLDEAVSRIPLVRSHQFDTSSVLADAKYYSSIGPGNSIKFFSRYIGEDNMIGIAMWESLFSRTALTGDIVIQPLRGNDNGVNDYITRRVRWLRVRKYMVLMATMIEPATESIFCGLFGNYAISSIFLNQNFSWKLFLLHISVWMITDYIQFYSLLFNISNLSKIPSWLSYDSLPPLRRSFFSWLYIWIIRELLAFPIWLNAIFGQEIDWRGRPFRIKKDLTAEEL